MINKSGFTLIEMVVVVGIVGIVMGIGVLSMRSYTLKASIEADSRNITALGNLARQYSFTHKTPLHVVLDDTGKIIQVQDNGNNIFKGLEYTARNKFRMDKPEDITLINGYVTQGNIIYLAIPEQRAEYDCIIFDTGRIKTGKSGVDGVCNAK